MTVHRLRRKTAAAPAAVAPLECVVIAVREHGQVDVELASGEVLSARCPHHVPIDWLEAVLKVGPVEALVLPSERMGAVLWGIFPDERHEAVRVAVHVRASTMTFDASEALTLQSGKSTVALKADGEVVVRGRDIVSRASEVNRIKGGRVRVN